MSRAINEDAPLDGVLTAKVIPIVPCITACGECSDCVRYLRSIHTPAQHKVPELSIKSRAEFYQVALREEGEAKVKLLEAEQALRVAQEAFSDASTQLTLTRDGLFKACGL